MKFIKLLILYFSLTIVLNGCSGFGEAGKVLRNEKADNSDEFLIKKNEPLSQPPEFGKIPEPRSIENRRSIDENDIEKILKTTRSKSVNGQNKTTSTEKSILEQIKK